jgi:hypothetical protein
MTPPQGSQKSGLRRAPQQLWGPLNVNHTVALHVYSRAKQTHFAKLTGDCKSNPLWPYRCPPTNLSLLGTRISSQWELGKIMRAPCR